MLTLTLHNEQDTDRLGAALAEVLPPGTVVALIGTLGAGKLNGAQWALAVQASEHRPMRQREAVLRAQAPHQLAQNDAELRRYEAGVNTHRHLHNYSHRKENCSVCLCNTERQW